MDGQAVDESIDVIVVGAGLAGVCASVTAAEAGARVLLLEKQPEPGGSTVLSSGLLAFAGTDEQRQEHLVDSVEQLRSDLLASGQGHSDTTLVDAYCDHQHAAYRWLQQLGIEFGAIHTASGQAVPRSHPTDAHLLVQTVLAAARTAGVEVRMNTPVHRLLVEDGAVRGVVACLDGVPQPVRGQVTVLCAGGFAMSEELLTRFAPQMRLARRVGGAGNVGDGLLMGCKVGAGLRDMPFIKGTFGIHAFADDHTGILAVYKGAVAVNVHGERFVDESLPYKVIGDACLEQQEAGAYQVFDQTVMDQADRGVPIYNFEERLDRGQVVSAERLEDLCRALDLPIEQTLHTIDAYNRAARGEETDEYGRTSLCSGVGTPTPVATPPYYAMPTTTVVLATYAGLTVDHRTRVLDVYGEPIAGLQAAGEVTGGFHGAGYMTGTSLGKCIVFGRIAGEHAARAATAS